MRALRRASQRLPVGADRAPYKSDDRRNFFCRQYNFPIDPHQRKGIWVTNAAEYKNGLRRQLNVGCQRLLALSQASVTEQTSCGRKYRKFWELLNGSFHRELVIHPGEYDQVRAMNRRKRFTKTATGKEGFIAQRTRRINQKNICVTSKLNVLETIVKKKDINGLPCFEPLTFGVSILAHSKLYSPL